MDEPFLSLDSGDPVLDTAFHIALGDLHGNIRPWRNPAGAYPEAPCVLAGLDYDTPWTRDAAFNAWYAGSLVVPGVARNTLLAVLERDAAGPRIGGQYWDAIAWVTAAWHHWLCTGDRDFLAAAFAASRRTLERLEADERDPADGLFRGGACFQDGIAGYPDRFADGPTSCILDWVAAHPRERSAHGFGLPMKALSTNCLYEHAYRVLAGMAAALGADRGDDWTARADEMRVAIDRRFWNHGTGTYRYLLDADDDPARQEGFGLAFAVLFGIAGPARTGAVFARAPATAHGIPCVWPGYARYAATGTHAFGRHAGTIWPQVNTAWTMAAVKAGRHEVAWFELRSLAEKACRDAQFVEIYHPLTGLPYGGMQEHPPRHPLPIEWKPCRRQSWCATGYLAMVLAALFGASVDEEGLSFRPRLPRGMRGATIRGLRYRGAAVSVEVRRDGAGPAAALVPPETTGEVGIVIRARGD